MTRESVAVGFPYHLHALFLFPLWSFRIADLCTSTPIKREWYLTLYKGGNAREQKEMEELDHDSDNNWQQIFDEESTPLAAKWISPVVTVKRIRRRGRREGGEKGKKRSCVSFTGEVRQCPDGRVHTLSKVREIGVTIGTSAHQKGGLAIFRAVVPAQYYIPVDTITWNQVRRLYFFA